MDITLALALSTHLNFVEDYNEIHPHIRAEHNQFIAGAFLNSESNISYYGGYQIEMDNYFVDLGIVTGYSDIPVAPFMRGGYQVSDKIDLFVAPGFEPGYDNVGLVAGLEFKF